MQLFYNPTIESSTQHFVFSKEESRHIVKVLRKKEGDLLKITNGKGGLFEVEITIASPNKCKAQLVKSDTYDAPQLQIHLAVAPTKMNERYEWFLEKATEIGVTSVTPIFCEHSERKVVKVERMKRIVESAAKQSLRYHFPVLKDPMSFKDFVTMHQSGNTLIAHCEDEQKQSLKQYLQSSDEQSYILMIGPEGDFSPQEIEFALQNHYIPISLGETRLRTETAAVVATHSFVFSKQ